MMVEGTHGTRNSCFNREYNIISAHLSLRHRDSARSTCTPLWLLIHAPDGSWDGSAMKKAS